jgi:Something about silencing, SAS, complex subunit 4
MNARKDSVNLVVNNNNHNGSEDRERPAKKARLDVNGEARDESPDPLNVLSPVAVVRKSAPASLSKRNKTVIIADDATTNTTKTKTDGQKRPEKRSLRSHDGGSRSKSELAAYFPNYEQIISLEPVKSEEFLVPGTVVTVLDDLSEPVYPEEVVMSPSKTRRQQKDSDLISPFGNPLLGLHGVERVDLSQLNSEAEGDPLGDDVYFKAHRRHERQEKQLRNIERERAQHEKIQLDRLLDELQGHDWLRVMGISGITDTEKKLYEPKRDYFVKEVCALIDKFRVWKEEEKRRKLERERVALEAAEEEEEEEEEEEDVKHPPSDVQSYDSSEVDAAAARQLIQEARSATETFTSPSNTPPKQRRRLVDALTSTPPKSRPHHHPELDDDTEVKPFVSFYPKRHLRDAAFASSRRNGRNRSAFGQPLPEMDEECEFRLPRDILTPELVHALERKRRRLKRESRG